MTSCLPLLWPYFSPLPCTLKLGARTSLVSGSSFLSFFQEIMAVWLLRMARSLSSSKPQACLKYSILESKEKHLSPQDNSFIKPDTSSGMLGWGKNLSPNANLLGTLIWHLESYQGLIWFPTVDNTKPQGRALRKGSVYEWLEYGGQQGGPRTAELK